MDEFKFVSKCLSFAALILILSQLKTGNTTIEARAQASLINTEVGVFINKVADGGVKGIRSVAAYVSNSFYSWKGTSKIEQPVPPARETATEKPSVLNAKEMLEKSSNDEQERFNLIDKMDSEVSTEKPTE